MLKTRYPWASFLKKIAMIVTTAIVTIGAMLGGMMTCTVYGAEAGRLTGGSELTAQSLNDTEVYGIAEECDEISAYRYTDKEESVNMGEQYIGSYVCGRAFTQIEKDGPNYIVNTVWGNSCAETVEWQYICSYDQSSGSLLCDGNGVKIVTVFDEDGEIASRTIVSSGDSAEFFFDGLNLTWEDHEEQAGRDMLFEKLDY